jgi:hypothetical protein
MKKVPLVEMTITNDTEMHGGARDISLEIEHNERNNSYYLNVLYEDLEIGYLEINQELFDRLDNELRK